MNKKLQAHSAIFFANTIFGLGVPVTKLLLDEWVTPMGYMASRSLGACILFWLIAAFMPKEHVERKDLITILLGGLLGFVISQTLTAWSLDYTSPVYFSLIATLTPVAVMLCAALSIGEKITVPDLRHRNGSNSVTRTLCQCPLHPVMGVGWRSRDGIHRYWRHSLRLFPHPLCDEIPPSHNGLDLHQSPTRHCIVRSHYAGPGCPDVGQTRSRCIGAD